MSLKYPNPINHQDLLIYLQFTFLIFNIIFHQPYVNYINYLWNISQICVTHFLNLFVRYSKASVFYFGICLVFSSFYIFPLSACCCCFLCTLEKLICRDNWDPPFNEIQMRYSFQLWDKWHDLYLPLLQS